MPCCGKYDTAAPWWNDWRYCSERRLMCRPQGEAIPAWQLTQPAPPEQATPSDQPGDALPSMREAPPKRRRRG